MVEEVMKDLIEMGQQADIDEMNFGFTSRLLASNAIFIFSHLQNKYLINKEGICTLN